MSNLFEFQKHGQTYLIDTSNDEYGISFWHKFSLMTYEPDTQALLEVYCNSNTVFMDIGAANGSMTILAASLGAKVWAYEPNPHVFQNLSSNIILNPGLVESVTLFNKAISITNDSLDSMSSALSDVLTPIVFTTWSLQESIKVASMIEEIRQCREINPHSEIVIKMDIEGAEWAILSNRKVLSTLQEERVTLIIALHPGLHRPIKNTTNWLFRLKLLFWNLRNLVDSYGLFVKLQNYGTTKRTNLNVVRRPIHFCLLILGGNHEFVIEFQAKSTK